MYPHPATGWTHLRGHLPDQIQLWMGLGNKPLMGDPIFPIAKFGMLNADCEF